MTNTLLLPTRSSCEVLPLPQHLTVSLVKARPIRLARFVNSYRRRRRVVISTLIEGWSSGTGYVFRAVRDGKEIGSGYITHETFGPTRHNAIVEASITESDKYAYNRLLTAMARFAKTLGLVRITAIVCSADRDFLHSLRSNRFVEEAKLPRAIRLDNQFHDIVFLGRLL